MNEIHSLIPLKWISYVFQILCQMTSENRKSLPADLFLFFSDFLTIRSYIINKYIPVNLIQVGVCELLINTLNSIENKSNTQKIPFSWNQLFLSCVICLGFDLSHRSQESQQYRSIIEKGNKESDLASE